MNELQVYTKTTVHVHVYNIFIDLPPFNTISIVIFVIHLFEKFSVTENFSTLPDKLQSGFKQVDIIHSQHNQRLW